MGFVPKHESNESLTQLRLRFNESNELLGDINDFDGVDKDTLTETIVEWVNVNFVGTDGDTLDGDLTITGDLTVQGDSFITETEEVKVENNLVTVNYGETGEGVTHNDGYAGIEVDRGTADYYYFVFEEERQRFVIGKDGELQVAATREDEPNDKGFAVWNGAEQRFDTPKKTITDGGSMAEEDDAIALAIALG